jgi:hypothetical protein
VATLILFAVMLVKVLGETQITRYFVLNRQRKPLAVICDEKET